MRPLLLAVTLFLSFTIPFCASTIMANSNRPFGVLTVAYDARLNTAAAYAGLSIFEGEEVSTGTDGRVGTRVGRVTLSLGGDTAATLHRIGENGAHVDLESATMVVTSPENSPVEVHADEALLRSVSRGVTQAQIQILSAKSLEIAVRRGGLGFRYRDECQLLGEGQTFRVFRDSEMNAGSPASGSSPASAAAPTAVHHGKVTAYIVLGAGAGAAIGVGKALVKGCQPEGPSNPATCR